MGGSFIPYCDISTNPICRYFNCNDSSGGKPICSQYYSRKIACPDSSGCLICLNLSVAEKQIQNQVSVHESQLIDVRSAITLHLVYQDHHQ